MNQFDRDKLELGWRSAMLIWIENRRPKPGFLSGLEGCMKYTRQTKNEGA